MKSVDLFCIYSGTSDDNKNINSKFTSYIEINWLV